LFSFGNFAFLYFSENMQITIAIKKVKMYAILWIFSITSNDRLFLHYYSNYFSSPISEKNDVHMWPIQIMLKWIEIEKVFLRWKYSHCISFTFIFLWGSALQKKNISDFYYTLKYGSKDLKFVLDQETFSYQIYSFTNLQNLITR
jgi:hypothetical protein